MFVVDIRPQQQTDPRTDRCRNILLAWVTFAAIVPILFIFTNHLSASLTTFIISLFMTSLTFYYYYSYVPEAESDEEHRAAPTGLSPAYIKEIPTFTYQENKCNGCDSLRCAVCITTVHNGDLVRQLLMCKHVFHTNCIDTWLPSHSTCPMCRADVKTGLMSSEKQELPV